MAGGSHGYTQPKWLFTPTGGWHYTPANWRANTMVGLGLLAAGTAALYVIGERGVYDETKQYTDETVKRWNDAAKKYNDKNQ